MSAQAYRYTLERHFSDISDLISKRRELFVWVMLNPSTADERVDDPTIRRVLAFSKREGATSVRVVNLFAARATDPRELAAMADPVGPDNDATLYGELGRADRVIVAWGAHPMTASRVPAFFRAWEKARRPQLWCFGTTQDGSPRHPLYLASSTPLVSWVPPRPASLAWVTRDYFGDFDDIAIINQGWCYVWAWLAYLGTPGSVLCTWTSKDYGDHAWIEIEGRAYDAERPEGIHAWCDLPFFDDVDRTKGPAYYQSRADFRVHWGYEGARNEWASQGLRPWPDTLPEATTHASVAQAASVAAEGRA